jgi:ribosomal protein S18 acetylase RimI-like enzyme
VGHAGSTIEQAVAAVEANLWSMWSQFGRGEGCRLHDEPRLMRFETPIRHVPYNSVMRFRMEHSDGDVDGAVDDVLDRYRKRDVPIMWVVHPTARPSDLEERLERRGLELAEVVPGMVGRLADVPPAAPVPAGVEVVRMGRADRDAFIDLIAWRYSLPEDARSTLHSVMERGGIGEPDSPNRAWLARRDGVVLSKVLLHLGAGCAGIYGVATTPEARGLGLARTLTIAALEHARDAGHETAVLHSTPMAVSLYEGIGFERVGDFRLWSLPGALHL